MMAKTPDASTFRIPSILNEYTRQYLAIMAEPHINSQDVIDQLYDLFLLRVLHRISAQITCLSLPQRQ